MPYLIYALMWKLLSKKGKKFPFYFNYVTCRISYFTRFKTQSMALQFWITFALTISETALLHKIIMRTIVKRIENV